MEPPAKQQQLSELNKMWESLNQQQWGSIMGLRINTNLASINAQRQLSKNQERLEHAQAALASGKRIVRAADDAAGLAISENLRGQVGGVKMARNNAGNAQSLVQVSEGGLNEIANIMVRLRELGVQAASDTVTDTERNFLDQEAQQLISEMDRIAKSTRFGDKTLLDGSANELEFHVGPYASEDNIIAYNFDSDAQASALGVDSISIADRGGARDALTSVDEGMTKLGQIRADLGAVQSRLQVTSNNLEIQYENLSAAKSRIADADVAHETAELTAANILQQGALSVLASANQNGAAAIRLLG